MIIKAVRLIRILIMRIVIRINLIILIINSTIRINISIIMISQLISQVHLTITRNVLTLTLSIYQVPVCPTQVTEPTGWRTPHFAK